jgi:short-subunit dehydrogenase
MAQQKTILITGATSGIGRHTALHLARRGVHVIASGRRADLLAGLVAEAQALGVGMDTVTLDVTDPDSISEAVVAVARLTKGRGIDGLVNNAGYGHPGPLEDVADAELRQQFETNVFGLMAVTRAFLPQLKERRGRLVNISSIGGRVTFPLFGAYHASKYAVEALSDALRNELAPFGVAVVLVEPGPIRTEFGDRAMATIQRGKDPSSAYSAIYARADKIEAMARNQEVGPEVVARAVEKGLLARHPRARYVVPFTSRLLVLLMRVLPSRWTDSIARRIVGLTPRGLGLATGRGGALLAGR